MEGVDAQKITSEIVRLARRFRNGVMGIRGSPHAIANQG